MKEVKVNKKFRLLPGRMCVNTAFTQKQKPKDYVLPGLLAGTVGCLYSQGGAGKSFFAVEAALEIVAGQYAGLLGLGIKTTGRVVYLSLEDPESITADRLYDMGEHIAPAVREMIAENLDILPLSGLGFDILDDDWFDEVVEYCQGARLVIIDTLSRTAAVDYNDPAQARRLMRRLERLAKLTGAAILFLHHVSKASVRAGQGSDQTAVQGASALIDDARWAGSLSLMSLSEAQDFSLSDKKRLEITDEQRKMFLKFSVAKINYGKVDRDMWFEKGHGGVLRPAILFPTKMQPVQTMLKPRNEYVAAKTGEMAIAGGNDEYDY